MPVRLAHAARCGVDVGPRWGPGRLAEEMFEALVVPSLAAPTFICDYPAATSPLTRDHRETPGLAEKFNLYVNGGVGLGIDRLMMAPTGLGIREPILFPLVKPEG